MRRIFPISFYSSFSTWDAFPWVLHLFLHFTLSFSSHSRRFLHLTSSDTSQWELSPDLLLDFSSELSVRPLLRPLIRPLSQTSQWDLLSEFSVRPLTSSDTSHQNSQWDFSSSSILVQSGHFSPTNATPCITLPLIHLFMCSHISRCSSTSTWTLANGALWRGLGSLCPLIRPLDNLNVQKHLLWRGFTI